MLDDQPMMIMTILNISSLKLILKIFLNFSRTHEVDFWSQTRTDKELLILVVGSEHYLHLSRQPPFLPTRHNCPLSHAGISRCTPRYHCSSRRPLQSCWRQGQRRNRLRCSHQGNQAAWGQKDIRQTTVGREKVILQMILDSRTKLIFGRK